MLTQLINNSGISIGMVGTPECSGFFEQEMQLARRSLGLKYGSMKYDMHFRQFCEKLFSYKYIKKEAILNFKSLLFEKRNDNSANNYNDRPHISVPCMRYRKKGGNRY